MKGKEIMVISLLGWERRQNRPDASIALCPHDSIARRADCPRTTFQNVRWF